MKRAFVMTTEPNRLLPLKVDKITISHDVASSIFVFFIASFLFEKTNITAKVSKKFNNN